jgi:hypothetical protein
MFLISQRTQVQAYNNNKKLECNFNSLAQSNTKVSCFSFRDLFPDSFEQKVRGGGRKKEEKAHWKEKLRTMASKSSSADH